MKTDFCNEENNLFIKALLGYLDDHFRTVVNYAKSKTHPSSLLADGIDIETMMPITWCIGDNLSVSVSNFASQQNWLRFLVGMSAVSHDEKYVNYARQQTQFFIEHNTQKGNLLFDWGGHRFLNVDNLERQGPIGKSEVHELKHHIPFYDFLHDQAPETIKQYLANFWQAHMLYPQEWDFSRHGEESFSPTPALFSKMLDAFAAAETLITDNSPTLETVGLTFINTGTDLIYAASEYFRFTREEPAIECAKLLFERYVKARHPKTGLPAYQYSSPKQRKVPPADDKQTQSWYGDRAKRQFGPEFGDLAKEGNVLFKQWDALLFSHPLAMLDIVKNGLLMANNPFIDRHYRYFFIKTVEYLTNYYEYAYDVTTHKLKPLWSDGTDLTNYVLKRDGYYGLKGEKLMCVAFKSAYLLPLVNALEILVKYPHFIADKREECLTNLSRLIKMLLGKFGFQELNILETDHKTPNIHHSKPDDEYLLLTLVMLSEIQKQPQLDDWLYRCARNLVKHRFHQQLFLRSKKHRYLRLDDPLPLILVHFIRFHITQQDISLPKPVPGLISSGGYLHGGYHVNGEIKIIFDTETIYTQTLHD